MRPGDPAVGPCMYEERLVQEKAVGVTTDEMAGEWKVSHGYHHHIIHEALQNRKVFASRVPKEPTLVLEEHGVDVMFNSFTTS